MKKKSVLVSNERAVKDKLIWRRGWEPKLGKNNFLQSSLLEQLIDGQISRKAAEKEVKQKARKKSRAKTDE